MAIPKSKKRGDNKFIILQVYVLVCMFYSASSTEEIPTKKMPRKKKMRT